jgi:hypothetical protein
VVGFVVEFTYMSFAPQHDWNYYVARTRTSDADWLRSSTADERVALYIDMFDFIWEARRTATGEWDRLDKWHWEQKCAARQRMLEHFNRWDHRQIERRAAHHAG